MSRDRAEWHEIRDLVARAAQMDFDCAIHDLPRVVPLLARDTGSAQARLRFYRLRGVEGSESGLDAAECTVRAELTMTCQRCLGEMQVPVAAHTELAFIEDEAQVASVPESHDPVMMTAGRVSFTDQLEEELLLAMPIAPMHAERSECPEQVPKDTADAETSVPTQTPFAGLRDLMKK